MDHHKPNTLVPDEIIRPDVLLCCGEDEVEMLTELRSILGSETPRLAHSYRCYRFFLNSWFTLVWTGIGTGCLEPLLFEILGTGRVKRIILVGTAGATSSARERMIKGEAYLINEATLIASGIRPHDEKLLSPSWKGGALINLKTARIASSDYYYGFSLRDDPATIRLRSADAVLKEQVANTLSRVDLVDMEVAQFYHLCQVIGDPNLQFVAIKGPANAVGRFEEQSTHSASVLGSTLSKGLELIGFTNKND